MYEIGHTHNEEYGTYSYDFCIKKKNTLSQPLQHSLTTQEFHNVCKCGSILEMVSCKGPHMDGQS